MLQNITISQYKELIEINNNKSFNSEIDRSIAILSVIHSLPHRHYYDLDIESLSDLISELGTNFTQNIEPQLEERLELAGKRFKLDANISKWSTRRYLDYTSAISAQNPDFSLIMSLLYSLDGQDVGECGLEERYKIFEEHCPIRYVLGVSDFFTLSLKSLTQTSLSSLMKKEHPKRKGKLMRLLTKIKSNLEG